MHIFHPSKAMLILILLSSASVSAQPASSPPVIDGIPAFGQIEAQVRQRLQAEGFRPTRSAAVDQTLEALLNAGYGIVATGSGIGGSTTFTLRDAPGRKWAFCTLSRAPGDAAGTANSQCTALN